LAQITGSGYGTVGLICVVISVVGLAASFKIERTEAAGGGKDATFIFIRDIFRTLASIRRKKELTLAIYASAYFLLVASFIHINVIPYGIHTLGLDENQSAYLFLVAALGIGTGAILSGLLSGRNIEFGIVPLGAIGLTFSSLGLGLSSGGLYPVIALLFLMGLSAGLFIVPINAFIQFASPKHRRGRVLAASAFLSWVGVLLASGAIYVFSEILKMSPSAVFVFQGVMTLVLAVVTVIYLPDFLVRFICIMLTKLCYRIKVNGTENVPVEGGVLLVSNHVSWADALLLASTQQRRIRFVMDKEFYNIWWIKPIAKLMGAIPISAGDGPKKIITALRQARAAMDEGYMVCVFAEGRLTRDGMLQSFKSGFERITKASSYEVIPVYLGGLWGSIFSRYSGKPLSTLPRKFPYPVSVHFGPPMPGESSASQIREKVAQLEKHEY
jgi:acyl-[acyl-carrier-protein]-phospholipid O-acyltransferase/long-chain-fatty-acid--[acyl-carrier-protein] ligase